MPEAIHTRQPAPAGIREDDDILQRRTLRDYYIMLRERLWVALPLALLLSIGYGYYKSRATPMYSAAATMQFEKPETIVTTQGVVDPAVHSEIDINTYVQILESQKLRAKVIASFTPEEQKIILRPAMKKLPARPAAPLRRQHGWAAIERRAGAEELPDPRLGHPRGSRGGSPRRQPLHPAVHAAAARRLERRQRFCGQLPDGPGRGAAQGVRDRPGEAGEVHERQQPGLPGQEPGPHFRRPSNRRRPASPRHSST